MSEREDYTVWKAYAENLEAQRENDSATIEELQEALARVEAELKNVYRLKDRYLARWRHSQSRLDKAISLLSFVYDHAKEHRPGTLPNEQVVRVFLAQAGEGGA